MPLFKGKSDEEKAQAAADEAQAEAARAQQAAALEAKKREREFAASPAGLAMAATAAGRRYFQMVRYVLSSDISATWEGNVESSAQIDQVETIEAVEDQGWLLHDVGYVFQETASDSKSKAIGSGERTAVSGKIVGIYLFRRRPESPA